ncbi:MAG: heme o synthase [Fimbriiglobus sp.]
MATADPPVLPAAVPRSRAAASPRVADYAELAKPKIAAMALVTVGVGYVLGAAPAFDPRVLLHTLFGAGLVAAGGSALNCWLERVADGRMWRTANRTLPAGRMNPAEAFSFGLSLAVGGVIYLLAALPNPAAAVVALATAILYVGVYTPLKRITTLNTVVGASPGALPPVIGWAAARGDVAAVEGWALFAILFVWQLPHFYSIAWMHRDDYARGGMVMLPVVDRRDGRRTGRETALWCAVLIPVTAAPFFVGAAGWVYLLGALPAAGWFFARTLRFARHRTNPNARSVLRGSLVYLLAVMALLVIDGVLPKYLAG